MLKPLALRVALAALAGGLLGGCYLYPAGFPLAWVALVPWLHALAGVSWRGGYGLGVVFGASLLAVGSYWIAPFIQAISSAGGWSRGLWAVVYWLLSAQVFGLLGLVLVGCRHFPGWIVALPVFGTLVFEFFPFVFPLNLGVTQTAWLASLQATAITGPAGLVALLLLGNALVYQLLRGRAGRGEALAMLLILAWLGYGVYALRHWDQAAAQWPRLNLGVVQGNAPASLPVPAPEPGFSYAYPPEMALYEQLAERGAELVIWPETRFKGYQSLAHVRAAFDTQVRRHGASLLLQDLSPGAAGATLNTAVLLSPAAAPQQYHKVKLIAFGETLPAALDRPAARAGVEWLLGEFYTPLAAGVALPWFAHPAGDWIPLICYEVAFPQFVASAVGQAPRAPRWLSVQSNDVWFAGTHQPWLHVAVSRLRAVENRLPLVHAINNGPSVAVAPSGRLLFQGALDQRRAYLLALPVPAEGRATFYNRYPHASRDLCAAAAGLLWAAALWRWARRRRPR